LVLPRQDIAEGAISWQIGGVGGATSASITTVAPFLVAGFVVCLLMARGLNALALGDELAAGLGQRVAWSRGIAAAGAVVLAGAVTAVTGPIAFVGLVVPHLCRLLAGARSEEHTSELQSRFDLVCRLLLEKKKRFDRISPF